MTSGEEDLVLARTRLFGHKQKITFRLPVDAPTGRVSVVGDFNGWTPGVDELRPRRGRTRTVSVTLPPGEHRFRYLGENGHWFDDLDADRIDGHGGIITIAPRP